MDDGGLDIFFRRSNIKGNPKPGARVTYSITKGTRGPRAVKIKILDASKATAANWFEFIGVRPLQRKIEDETTL